MARWLIAGIAAFWAGLAVADVAEPAYTVAQQDGAFEVRRYAPMLVAEVDVEGSRSAAANRGFRILADYIFGGNAPKQKIAMTAPVEQEPLGVTVEQEPVSADRWTVRFVMPAEMTRAGLPEPDTDAIRFVERPARQVAVRRFSGFNSEGKLAEESASLMEWVAARGLKPSGPLRFAFYDPPWRLPWQRRNEVMIPVAR